MDCLILRLLGKEVDTNVTVRGSLSHNRNGLVAKPWSDDVFTTLGAIYKYSPMLECKFDSGLAEFGFVCCFRVTSSRCR